MTNRFLGWTEAMRIPPETIQIDVLLSWLSIEKRAVWIKLLSTFHVGLKTPLSAYAWNSDAELISSIVWLKYTEEEL